MVNIRKSIKALMLLSAMVVAFLIALVSYTNTQVNQPLAIEKERLFEIPKGYALRVLGRDFVQKGWFETRFWLRVYSRLHPELAHIKEGVYLIKPGQSTLDVLQMFVAGKEHQFSITFIEGTTISDWLKTLKNAPYLTHSLPAKYDASIKAQLAIKHEHIDGLLFPDTYSYTAYTKDVDILKRAKNRMNTHLLDAWENKQHDLPYQSPYEALIMASIIEKETGQIDEQPLISAVFVNRLNKKMRLQTDPTVIYGLGNDYNGDITRAHLRQKTRYNTYRINGLPPTPIAMPGKSAIIAALNPVQSDFLYFVSKGNGWHQFSKTLAEHNKAVAKYQLGH